jgi:hypothetical protein
VHNNWQGREFDREWVRHGGPALTTEELRQALGRVCVRRVRWVVSLHELQEAERRRETGQGRRPSDKVTLRLSRREEKADLRYQNALTEYRALVRRHEKPPTSGQDLLALAWRAR